MGGAFGQMAGGMFSNSNGFAPGSAVADPLDKINQNNSDRYQQTGNEETASTKFESDNDAQTDPVESLKKLKQMLDLNLISQETYDEKMQEILARM